MKQHLAELVNAILEQIKAHPELPATRKGMRTWLVDQGYKKGDVEAALKMVFPIPTRRQPPRHAYGSIRHLARHERLKLTHEAQNALLRLELYELIHPHEVELLLDQLPQIDGQVGLEELSWMLAWLFYTHRDVTTQTTFNSLLDLTPPRH